MKKFFIMLLAIIVIVSNITLVACNDIDSHHLEILYNELRNSVSMADTSSSQINITNSSFNVPASISYIDAGKTYSANVLWSIQGDDKITIDNQINKNFYTVNVPAKEENDDLTYTLSATLVNNKQVPYKNTNRTPFTIKFLCKVTSKKNDILNTYIFEKENQFVYQDFSLPKYLYYNKEPIEVKWVSNSILVKLTEKTDEYLAEITYPENEIQVVQLKVVLNDQSKAFNIKVSPIDIEDIASNYIFSQKNTIVYSNFNLDTETVYKGKTAKITWSVKTGEPFIKISSDNKTCIVNHQNTTTKVTLTATFSYNDKFTTRNYSFTVAYPTSQQ